MIPKIPIIAARKFQTSVFSVNPQKDTGNLGSSFGVSTRTRINPQRPSSFSKFGTEKLYWASEYYKNDINPSFSQKNHNLHTDQPFTKSEN